MKLVVRTPGYTDEEFEGLYRYATTTSGELDIFDGETVVATYAISRWDAIRRYKNEDEEWPKEPEVDLDEGNDEEGLSQGPLSIDDLKLKISRIGEI